MLKFKSLRENPSAAMFVGFMGALGAGLLLSGTEIAGVSSFADISLSGALPLPFSAAVLVGSLVRSIVVQSVGKNIVRLSAMMIMVVVRMFTERLRDAKACGILTAAAVLISGTAVSAIIGEAAYKLLFYVFYGALSGYVTYCISQVITGLKRKAVIDLSSASGSSYAVAYIMLISALCSVSVLGLNLGVIVGVTVTLTAAYYYRQTGGAVCGALTSCGAFLASADVGMSVVLLSVAGLLTGCLYRIKCSMSAAFFLGVNFMLIILSGITENGIYSMFNFIIAAIVFVLTSPYYSDKRLKTGNESAAVMPMITGTRMSFLSGTVRALRKDSERLTGLLSAESSKSDPTDEAERRICTDCYRRNVCWRSGYNETLRGFRKLSAMNEFSEESFPYELEDCLHRDELKAEFENSRRERSTEKLMEMRSSDSRAMLCEQIRAVEDITESAGVEEPFRYSAPVSSVVRDKLCRFGLEPRNVIAGYNEHERLMIELYFGINDSHENTTRICDLISDELGIPLCASEPVQSDKEVRLRLFEAPEYKAEIYGATSGADDSCENGDSFTCFGDGSGREYVVLSDGMGSGRNAAIGSRMAVNIFKRLISGGLGSAPAIKLINSILLTKPGDEGFATLDALIMDLDTCAVTLIKSGAAATMIRRGDEVLKVSAPTFPIGIYEQSEAFTDSLQLADGDILIMFSDGITENEYRFIRELLLGSDDIRHIVDEICAKAEVFNPAVHADDVTVIGVKITSRAGYENTV